MFAIRNFDKEARGTRKELADKAAAVRRTMNAPKTLAETKLASAAARISEVLSEDRTDAWQEIRALAEAVGKGKLLRSGDRVKAAVSEVETLLERYIRLRVQQLSAPVKAEFRRLFFRWKERYEAQKRRLASYDFSDLLFFTYTVFSGGGAAHCPALVAASVSRSFFTAPGSRAAAK